VFVVGTDRSLTFREIAKAVYSERGRLPRDAREELQVTKVYDPHFGTTTSATHIVALEIDPATYKVKLDRYVQPDDRRRPGARRCRPRHRRGTLRGGHLRRCRSTPDGQSGRLCHPDRERDATDYNRPSRDGVLFHIRWLARDGRRRNDRRAGGHRQRAGRCVSPTCVEIFELPMTPVRLFCLVEKVKAAAQGE
jgi:carbon-monoxide dehydrogenase large subunit